MQIVRCLCLLSAVALSHAQPLNWVSVPDEMLTRRLSEVPVKNEDRGGRLEEMLNGAGCTGDRLKRGRVNKKWENIICTLPGSTDEVIVVGAHYDHVGRGEGAVDNWSGSSMLVSLYQTIAASERRFTYMFVGFAEEEKGLYGARAFVKDLGKEKLSKVKAMVNIDSVGMTPPKVWVTRSDKQLIQMIARVAAATKIPIAGMNVDRVGESDSRPFADRKIPVLDIHSLTTETLPVLHSEKDTLSVVVMQHYADTYRLLAATLVYMDREFRP